MRIHCCFLVTLTLSIVLTHQIQAQNILIKGSVKGSNGAAVPFASVTVGRSNSGVKADSLGLFTLSAGAKASLRISAIGFTDTVIAINGRTSIDIVLQTRPPQELGEAVISGTDKSASPNLANEANKD